MSISIEIRNRNRRDACATDPESAKADIVGSVAAISIAGRKAAPDRPSHDRKYCLDMVNQSAQRRLLANGTVLGCFLAAVVVAGCNHPAKKKAVPPAPTSPVALAAADETKVTDKQVYDFCGACHAFPDPSTFPKSEWRHQVLTAYNFASESRLKRPPASQNVPVPPLEPTLKWFEDRAPKSLPEIKADDAPGPPPVRFRQIAFDEPGMKQPTGISNVNLVHLYSKDKLDLLVCDARSGNVMVMKPYEKSPALKIVAKLHNPARAEVVDLDKDGIKDLIVADLGSYVPTNKRCGSVVWLRGRPDGTFTPYTLWSNVGRISDVEMADFYGTGRNDLIVAEFGANGLGSITLLENQTADWSHPAFTPHEIDDRTGTIHVPICDLNHDGKPDFIGLISQEHETIVAFINQGNGVFTKETIYGPLNPAVGSSGIQLVDMNHDGKLDVLYTCGDTWDAHAILRPEHGIIWLENKGTFPFTAHWLTHLNCTYRAVAADVDGDGLLDIYATALVPPWLVPKGVDPNHYDSIVLLKQTAPGKFTRYALEKGNYYHVSCVAGDIYGDGKQDLVTGYFAVPPKSPIRKAVTIWRNLGR